MKGKKKMKKIKNQVKRKIDKDYYYVPDEVSETEALIYDWVVYHFGKEEVMLIICSFFRYHR